MSLTKEFPFYWVKKHYPDRTDTEKWQRKKFALSYAQKLWQWREEHPERLSKVEVFEVRSEIDFESIAVFYLGQTPEGLARQSARLKG